MPHHPKSEESPRILNEDGSRSLFADVTLSSDGAFTSDTPRPDRLRSCFGAIDSHLWTSQHKRPTTVQSNKHTTKGHSAFTFQIYIQFLATIEEGEFIKIRANQFFLGDLHSPWRFPFPPKAELIFFMADLLDFYRKDIITLRNSAYTILKHRLVPFSMGWSLVPPMSLALFN